MLHGFPSHHTDEIPTCKHSSMLDTCKNPRPSLPQADAQRLLKDSVTTDLRFVHVAFGHPGGIQHCLRASLRLGLRDGSAVLIECLVLGLGVCRLSTGRVSHIPVACVLTRIALKVLKIRLGCLSTGTILRHGCKLEFEYQALANAR